MNEPGDESDVSYILDVLMSDNGFCDTFGLVSGGDPIATSLFSVLEDVQGMDTGVEFVTQPSAVNDVIGGADIVQKSSEEPSLVESGAAGKIPLGKALLRDGTSIGINSEGVSISVGRKLRSSVLVDPVGERGLRWCEILDVNGGRRFSSGLGLGLIRGEGCEAILGEVVGHD